MTTNKYSTTITAIMETYLHSLNHPAKRDRMLSQTYFPVRNGTEESCQSCIFGIKCLKKYVTNFREDWALDECGGCSIAFRVAGYRIEINIYHHYFSPKEIRFPKGKRFIVVIHPRTVIPEDEDDTAYDEEDTEDEEEEDEAEPEDEEEDEAEPEDEEDDDDEEILLVKGQAL